MPALQPKEHLRAFTQLAHRRLVSDLNAIAADKNNASPGGCARSALHIVAECAMINQFIAEYLTTGRAERPSPEQRAAHLDSFNTSEKALAYLETATQQLLDAIEALDEETLGDVSDQPLRRPISRFAVAELPAVHMSYHDGQLAYIQTLHGDDQNHWG